ncbi:MAG: hypothetical protein ABIJ09_04750 [Pseudomonadota bacterium]
MSKKLTQTLVTLCICTGLIAALGARGGCVPTPCPDLYIACPALECPDGFKVDKNGCAICECIGEPAPVKCMGDADCADAQFCSFETCQTPPDCEDGMDCMAVCFGLCKDRGGEPCAADIDCARGEVCINGVCMGGGMSCWSDAECPAGLVCDTVNYCEAAPGCEDGMACPAVCYGRCVEPNHGECYSDADCGRGYFCAFLDGFTNCDDGSNCGGDVAMGQCLPYPCPEYAPPYCPSGEIVGQGYDEYGCPLPPICLDDCANLSPEECERHEQCMLIEMQLGMPCRCDCPAGDANCACECPPPVLACVPREPLNCGQLDEQQCLMRADCEPIFGGVGCACPACLPGEECYPCDCMPPIDDVFMGCTERRPQGCEGLSMDQCLAHPECELLEVPMGRPCACDCPPDATDCICEDCHDMGWMCVPRQPPPPPQCRADADCPAGFFCALMDCANDGTDCMGGGICLPVEPPRCGDGTELLCDMVAPDCRDDQELAVINHCWACVPAGQCQPFPTCDTVRCAGGTHCEMVQVQCFTEPCYPIAMCVPDAAACQNDADCRDGFFCNTCPSDPNCPMCDVCGPAVCQPVEPLRCQSDRDCDNGYCDICEECMGPQTVGVCVVPNCDDGSEPLCDRIPPVCQPGQTLAVRNNCYECVDARSCGEPTLTCANVRCQAGFHCEMVQVQCFTEPCPPMPECLPDETDPPVCEDNTACSDGSVCINGRCGG